MTPGHTPQLNIMTRDTSHSQTSETSERVSQLSTYDGLRGGGGMSETLGKQVRDNLLAVVKLLATVSVKRKVNWTFERKRRERRYLCCCCSCFAQNPHTLKSCSMFLLVTTERLGVVQPSAFCE